MDDNRSDWYAFLVCRFDGGDHRGNPKEDGIKGNLYATAILVGSMGIGQILLGRLGIQLISLQIAGGIILFLFGLQMIFGTVGQLSPQTEQDHDLAVFSPCGSLHCQSGIVHGGDCPH